MNIAKGIETGKEYFWKRTNGWKWIDGNTRWWEIFVEFNGFNGAGGVWLIEHWRWNDSIQTVFSQPRTLSNEKSIEIIEEIQKEFVNKWGEE